MPIEPIKKPRHIGIIMDGNRRWARYHKLPHVEGHRQGALTLEKVVSACAQRGVETLTVYALSTENRLNRTRREISGLMRLLGFFLKSRTKKLHANGVSLAFLGELREFPRALQDAVNHATDFLKQNERIKLNIALNYGGRDEIVNAVKKIIDQGVEADRINEETLSRNLYTNGQEDPDLIIRTGGEYRLSNFLLWQSSYSELYFTSVLWPDFTEKDLDRAIEEFSNRKRKFGQ